VEDVMPNIKSQKKRVITNQKANDLNKAKRAKVRAAIKAYEAAIEAKDVTSAEKLLTETISIIDKARYDGIYKDNTASRKISRITKQLNKIKA
jgi:small subunit ribosomal protein S20